MLHAGSGETQVSKLLTTMNLPTLNHRTLKARERDVGCCVEAVAQDSCKEVQEEEKTRAR